MQIFRENDRSHPAQVVAAQIRTLLHKHEGCTGFVPSPGLKSYFVMRELRDKNKEKKSGKKMRKPSSE